MNIAAQCIEKVFIWDARVKMFIHDTVIGGTVCCMQQCEPFSDEDFLIRVFFYRFSP